MAALSTRFSPLGGLCCKEFSLAHPEVWALPLDSQRESLSPWNVMLDSYVFVCLGSWSQPDNNVIYGRDFESCNISSVS